MGPYYFQDKPEGQPDIALRIWQQAHTLEALASKIRAHLERVNMKPLSRVGCGHIDLSIQE